MKCTQGKEIAMYKVFPVEGGYQIFWCPSAPLHFNDKIPYDGKVYSKKQAAYRKVKQLREQLEAAEKPAEKKEKAVA